MVEEVRKLEIDATDRVNPGTCPTCKGAEACLKKVSTVRQALCEDKEKAFLTCRFGSDVQDALLNVK